MRYIALLSLILLAAGCRDAAGPSSAGSPGGPCVVWFNGNSATADGFWTDHDSLITSAWSTGTAPNHIVVLEEDEFLILSSLSAEISLNSIDLPGEVLADWQFAPGSNPYSMAVCGDTGFTTLLLLDSVRTFGLPHGSIGGSFATRANPSGIAATPGHVFVSYASWPSAQSPGGVSVYERDGYEEVGWVNTGVNTHWLTLQSTGRIHCYGTTYQDDGTITVISAEDPWSVVAVIECGGAPGEGVAVNGDFLSPDGWGQGGLVRYDESGNWERIDTSFPPTDLAVHDGIIYATSFSRNRIYLLDAITLNVIDSLPSGGEGPQGIVAVDP